MRARDQFVERAFSRRLGRRIGRGGSSTPKAAAPNFTDLFLGSGSSKDVWFDADSFTQSAGNITALVDQKDASHTWPVSGTVAVPSADSALNNALSCAFTGTQFALSSRANTDWTFLHNGSGMTLVHVHVKTSDTLAILFATSGNPTSGNGLDTYVSTTSTYTSRASNALGAGGGPVTTGWPNAGAFSLCMRSALSAPTQYELRRNGSVLSSGAYGGAPSPAAASFGLTLGRSGGSGFIGRWAATYVFHRYLSAVEMGVVSAWTLAKYGLSS